MWGMFPPPTPATKKSKYSSIQNYNLTCYGCQTWILALREKCRIRVFFNEVLRTNN
jgi:hypothetical protein